MTEERDPAPEISKAIERQLKRLSATGDDRVADAETAVKIIRMAIEWVKVKHHIRDDDDAFNPENM